MDSTNDYLICPVCLEYAEDAVENTCCHAIFCEACIQSLAGKPCPSCRESQIISTPSTLARRMIGVMQIDCPLGCPTKVPRSEIKSHIKTCPNKEYICSVPNCQFKGKKTEFLEHVNSSHQDIMLQTFVFDDAKALSLLSLSYKSTVSSKINILKATDEFIDPIKATPNAKGREARLGTTGKFYCQGPLEKGCKCCDGYCGPCTGCNCTACMELDVKRRRLPVGYLVNSEGFTVRKGEKLFYCGRRFAEPEKHWDGYCGPTNGKNCESCEALLAASSTRYKTLL